MKSALSLTLIVSLWRRRCRARAGRAREDGDDKLVAQTLGRAEVIVTVQGSPWQRYVILSDESLLTVLNVTAPANRRCGRSCWTSPQITRSSLRLTAWGVWRGECARGAGRRVRRGSESRILGRSSRIARNDVASVLNVTAVRYRARGAPDVVAVRGVVTALGIGKKIDLKTRSSIWGSQRGTIRSIEQDGFRVVRGLRARADFVAYSDVDQVKAAGILPGFLKGVILILAGGFVYTSIALGN